ncbi:Hypothetical_protein [Hexamita inflata]|uniref:Hypothetical_protein n=1 Tax=Hexamita inflata TaxID=28002 RepID=A0AA86NWI1_9EUKA|nr:Hypothetical protein HINF_LOCUS14167 [Hexamita inflata]
MNDDFEQLKKQFETQKSNYIQLKNDLAEIISSQNLQTSTNKGNSEVQIVKQFISYYQNQIVQLSNSNEQKNIEIIDLKRQINTLSKQVYNQDNQYQEDVLVIADILFLKCKSLLVNVSQHKVVDKILVNMNNFITEIKAQRIVSQPPKPIKQKMIAQK